MARVLLARGFDDPDRARRHLRPELADLHDPFAFASMPRAIDRIRRAIAGGQRIMIHGDYDVDGISGTVLLLKLFALVEATAKPFIPARSDGYSFTEASVRAAKEGAYDLCISVDNGTNAGAAIAEIQRHGCDVIVTDHHGTTDNVAPAYTVLNPRLHDAGYPDRELAGVGVAFTVARALAESFSRGKMVGNEFRNFLLDAMAYVALGTVADVAPLRGENRILVFHGLRALAASRNPGIKALLDVANSSSPGTEDIAFRIAPMINAAGRVGHALEAVKAFLAPGYSEAQEAAKLLEKRNQERRKVERSLTEEVLPQAMACTDSVLVFGGEGDHWHPGVLGIVASRLAENTGKPSIVIAFNGPIGRGSGRSGIGSFDLRQALVECTEHLRQHGGHRAAVGLEIQRECLDSFRTAINAHSRSLPETKKLTDTDGSAAFAELDSHTVRRMDMLGPFGAGNTRPKFVSGPVRLIGQPSVDRNGHTLRFRVAQNGTILPARFPRSAERFEELRAMQTDMVLTYSPRLVPRAEHGPVELIVHELDPL